MTDTEDRTAALNLALKLVEMAGTINAGEKLDAATKDLIESAKLLNEYIKKG